MDVELKLQVLLLLLLLICVVVIVVDFILNQPIQYQITFQLHDPMQKFTKCYFFKIEILSPMKLMR